MRRLKYLVWFIGYLFLLPSKLLLETYIRLLILLGSFVHQTRTPRALVDFLMIFLLAPLAIFTDIVLIILGREPDVVAILVGRKVRVGNKTVPVKRVKR